MSERVVAYARILIKGKEGYTLKPSKNNPRVKRWQKEAQSSGATRGKADLAPGEVVDPNGLRRVGAKRTGISSGFIAQDPQGRRLYVKKIDPRAAYGRYDSRSGRTISADKVRERMQYGAHAEVGASVVGAMAGVPGVTYGYLGSPENPQGVVSEAVPQAVAAGRLYRGWPGFIVPRWYGAEAKGLPWHERYLERFAHYGEKSPEEIAYQMGQLLSFGILMGDMDRHSGNYIVAPGRGLLGLDYGRSFPNHIAWEGGMPTDLVPDPFYGFRYRGGTPGFTLAPEQRPKKNLWYPRPTGMDSRQIALEQLRRGPLQQAPDPLREGFEDAADKVTFLDWDEAAERQGLPDHLRYPGVFG